VASCTNEPFFKRNATITANLAVLDVLGKMHPANSENAFHFSPTLSHSNLVDLASNMIVDSNKCQAAGLICDEFLNIHAFNDVTSPHIETVNDLQRNFFVESSLVLGSEMSLHQNLGSPFPTRSFLSSAIAGALPSIDTHNLGKILEIFGIRYGTPMARMIETTTRLCGDPALPGEERACATSFEEIMAFATTHLGNNVQLLATTGAPAESAPASTPTAPVKVMGYRKHYVEDGKRAVVCHELMFPSAMYYCHRVTSVKVIDASLASAADPAIPSNNQIQATAMCHMDTTLWLSRHPAFAALHIARGKEACHYLSAGDLVFAQAATTNDA
jgi:hypothetical protein